MDIANRRIKCADSYIEKARTQTCNLTYFATRDKKSKDIMSPWLIFLDKLSLALFPVKKYIQLKTNVFDFCFWKFNATMSKFSDFQRRTQILLRQKCWQLDFKNSFGWTQIRNSSYALSKNGHNSWRIFSPHPRGCCGLWVSLCGSLHLHTEKYKKTACNKNKPKCNIKVSEVLGILGKFSQ